MAAIPVFDRAVALAHHLEIPLTLWDYTTANHPKHRHGRFTWDGKTLMLDEYDEIMDTCHEIAHYIVSEPWQRGIPDYGLGLGPNSYRTLDREIKNKAERMFILKDTSFIDEQENLASLLTIYVALYIEVPINAIMYTANETGWRWHEYVRNHYVPDRSDPSKQVFVKDLSKIHLYDERSMREFFTTLLELHRYGFLTHKNELVLGLNKRMRSPFDLPRSTI